MVLTILEAHVPPGQEGALQAAYEAALARPRPQGLVRSELLRDTRDTTRWRIQTLWESGAALEAMRTGGTPAGVLMFRAASAEPELSIFDVVDALATVGSA
jgi:heme-degrading monooxygenase HmoA